VSFLRLLRVELCVDLHLLFCSFLCISSVNCGVNQALKHCVDAGLHCNEIQESLCDAVNNLVKHFYKPEKEASSAGILFAIFLVFSLHNVCGASPPFR